MPGVSGNGPSNNIRGEVFLSKGIALAVDQVAKLRGRELAQAPPGFNVLGDCGNGAEQDTAAWTWMSSGWFGLVNLTIVLACKNNLSSRRDESKTYLLKSEAQAPQPCETRESAYEKPHAPKYP